MSIDSSLNISSIIRDLPLDSSHLTQSFRDQRRIETFLRANKSFKLIENAAANYVNTYQSSKQPEDAFAAIVLRLPFEYADFLEHSLEVLHFAVEEPELFASATKYCVYAIVRDLIKASTGETALRGVDIDQVHVLVRFVGLPLQEDLLFEPSKQLYRAGLSLVWGVLSALTDSEKAAIQSVWYCSAGCMRNRIKSETQNVPVCSNCSRQMSEYTKLRTTHSYRLLQLLPLASVQTPIETNRIFRAITVRLQEHTYTCELSLGSRYLITGFYDFGAQEFQAWNLIAH